MESELSNEMSLLFKLMKEELKKQTNDIKETITTNVLMKVEEKIKPVIEENEKLREEVTQLNKKIDYLDLNARKNNVILHGISEPPNEKIEDLIGITAKTIEELGVKLVQSDINRVQRLGKKINAEKSRPILLSTTTLQKKIDILKNKNKMKPATYITHDFPKKKLQEKKEQSAKRKDKRKRTETESPSPNKLINDEGGNNTKLIKRFELQKAVTENLAEISRSPVLSPAVLKINDGNREDGKGTRIDAFQIMRERAYSLSEKNTWQQ